MQCDLLLGISKLEPSLRTSRFSQWETRFSFRVYVFEHVTHVKHFFFAGGSSDINKLKMW